MLPSLRRDLERVEGQLVAAVKSTDGFLTSLARHLMTAGGKRVRPGFCLASSLAYERDGAAARHEAVMGGAAVELVHIGSLYHDDVLDGAATRRSVASVNARWGNLRAILAGDYLLGRASEIAASLGGEVAGLLATTITRLCEGQIVELEAAYDVGRSERGYERAIAGKTAALLATSCRIGAVVADLRRDDADDIEEFGRAYGMAFQIVDDILDLVATDSQLGKPAGNDLLEGNYTLPVILALADPSAGGELRSVLRDPISKDRPDRLDKARSLVLATAGVAQAHARARIWADRAQAALAGLPDTPAAASLRAAADHLMDRLALASLPA